MSVKKITKKAVHVKNFLSTVHQTYKQLNSSDKLNEHIFSEFKHGSKPIKLINRQKVIWISAIVYYNSDYLYVRIPQGLEPNIGSPLMVQFPSEEGNYVIESLIHKITPPILCLKLQDPRRDIRYQPLSFTNLYYLEVNPQAPWLLEKDIHIIRLAEEEERNGQKIFIKDTIGIPKDSGKDGELIFAFHQGDHDNLDGSYHKAGLHDISIGGASVNLENGNLKNHSLIHMHLTLSSESQSVKEIEISLFGIINNIFPLNETDFRCGISFINRIDVKPFHSFLQRLNAN